MPRFSDLSDPACASEECRRSRTRMENELQQLREKLEYSQLQIESLTLERDRLREQLREATFRDRSSISPTSAPSLPDEILHHIFALATCFEGLASPAWDNTAGSGWKTSSVIRRCIPLVSRRWHAIGLELLYEHIALWSNEQISSLLHALNRVSASVREQRMDWIRGPEFNMPSVSLQSIVSEFHVDQGAELFVNFEKLALRLLQILPGGRLRRLGIDCGGCDGLNTERTTIAMQGLAKSQRRLEMFHVSCVEATQKELPNALTRVHTLSRVSRCPCACDAMVDSPEGFFANLGTSAHSTRKVLVKCGLIEQFSRGDFGRFLQSAVYLDTLHVHIHGWSRLYLRQLKRWLEEFPQLRCLLIHIDVLLEGAYQREIELAHPLLEEITIYLETGTRYGLGDFIPDLRLQIESVNLPKLQRITMHGDFPEGCLDAHRIFCSEEYRRWDDGLDWCTLQGLDVVNHEGDSIHLWRCRHGPKLEASGESDSSGSEGEEWFKRSDTDSFSNASEATSGFISDDSDDAPYRYVYQPDIEQVNSDSE